MENTLETQRPMWKDILEILISAVLIYMLVNIFLIPSKVNQSSMVPTFEDNDLIFATRGYLSGNRYERGDIILFNDGDKVLIKRIIGVPGDKLNIKEGKVYINNAPLNEPYLEPDIYTNSDIDTTIHEDCYFVMGDNRYNSMDSRIFGEIQKDSILGIVRFRMFPHPATF